jgi:hypothetical protein
MTDCVLQITKRRIEQLMQLINARDDPQDRASEVEKILAGQGRVQGRRVALVVLSPLVSTSARDHFLFGLSSPGFRKRTPAPPPFSSMKTTPSRVKTSLINVSVAGSPA